MTSIFSIRKIRSSKWCNILMLCIVYVTATFLLSSLFLSEKSLQIWKEALKFPYSKDGDIEVKEYFEFIVETDGCKIPNFVTRDIVIFDHISNLETLPKCTEVSYSITSWDEGQHQRGPPLVESNLTTLWVESDVFEMYGISDSSLIKCCYRPFQRIQENPQKYTVDADNRVKFSETCFSFEVTVDIESHEFVRVECSKPWMETQTSSNNLPEDVESQSEILDNKVSSTKYEIYRDFHAFVPKKPLVEARCDKAPHTADDISILMLGLDSMSRLNLLREMPLLHTVLTSPPLNAISLLGYTKVGDNTFPNLIPIFTGLAEEDLKNACPWPTPWHKLDNCPFIWKDYARNGYRTAYGEDAAWMAGFQHMKTGFVKPPTDYYLRPFIHEAEKEMGHSNILHADYCIGPRMSVAYVLNYMSKFCEQFKNDRTFGFFWTTSLTHDYLTFAHNGDQLFSTTIHSLVTRGILNTTVLIVFSDHGMRWGSIRETYQGIMEERLPFFYISFPEWFKRLYPEAVNNVRLNAQRLTSPYDVYETLQDLLYPLKRLTPQEMRRRSEKEIPSFKVSMKNDSKYETNYTYLQYNDKTPNTMNKNKKSEIYLNNMDVCLNKTNKSLSPEMKLHCEFKRKVRGISLFLPIQGDRTCENAAIPPHYCTCQSSIEIPIDSPLTTRIAIFVVHQINYWLRNHLQCHLLQLMGVRNARINNNSDISREKSLDYTITLITGPGRGVFEATVREKVMKHESGKTVLSLGGPISRINLYGNQSYCMDDYKLKLYCYCLE